MAYEYVTPRPDWIFERRALVFNLIGRLRPGVTIEQAEAEMKTIAANLEQEYPEPNGGRSVVLHTLSRIDLEAAATIALAVTLLTGIALLVLAIAAANVANLLMVRASSRRREIAVRVSLGAGRMRLVRQLLTESLVLAGLGGVLGIFIAVWARELLWSLVPPSPFPIALDTSLDFRVLGFALLITMGAGLFFGLIPAVKASRPNLSEALKTGHQRDGTMRRWSVRNVLVVAQVSLSLVALVTAGLMVRSIENVFAVDPGFDKDRLLAVTLPPLGQSYRDTKSSTTLLVRTSGDPTSVAADVRSTIRRIDPNLPITNIQAVTDVIEFSMFNAQIGVWLVSVFGLLALVLAAVGVYGVISYAVSQRTHEIGIRMALGARPGDALSLIVRQGIVLSLLGLSIGLALSVGVTRVLSTFLFGVSAVDPLVFGGISLVLGVVAGAASFVPARRAVRIDPMLALPCRSA